MVICIEWYLTGSWRLGRIRSCEVTTGATNVVVNVIRADMAGEMTGVDLQKFGGERKNEVGKKLKASKDGMTVWTCVLAL